MAKARKIVDIRAYKVPDEELCATCNVSDLKFKTTEELLPHAGFIGQERAEQALRRAFALKGHGYNPFIIEAGGSGRSASIRWFVERMAEQYLADWKRDDWCYVYNFEDPGSPKALRLARGKGKDFKEFVERELLPYLEKEILPIAELKNISPDDREDLRKANEKRQSLMLNFEHELEAVGEMHGFVFALLGLKENEYGRVYGDKDTGIYICYPGENPRPIKREDEAFLSLPEEQKKELFNKAQELGNEFFKVCEDIKDCSRAEQNLVIRIIETTVRTVFLAFVRETQDVYEGAQDYFQGLENFTAKNYWLFLPEHGNDASSPGEGSEKKGDPFLPFRINFFSAGTTNIPVIVDDNPTFYNLFGKLEREGLNVAPHSVPSHMDLKAGSVHQSNGGVLIANALDILTSGSWRGLKRVLLDERVKIEDLASEWGVPLRGLKPEPIPVKVKVLLIGNAELYNAFSHSVLRDEFKQLFKIPVYFDYETPRTPDNVKKFSQLIAGWCGNGHKAEGALHLDSGAVAKVIEYGSRLVTDKEMLSLNMRMLKDLCVEAGCVAREGGFDIVQAGHVEQALIDRIFRVDLARQKIYDFIKSGSQVIHITDYRVGEMNGLTIFGLEDISFGSATRITCNTSVGQAGIISIDREAKLSGQSYDKGLLTLTGYLAWKYGQSRKISLTATICLEQSFGIDGNSASSVEIYAILSSLSGIPLRQDIAATGAVSQKGDVLAIGGVNQKVEGFYDICCIKGLTGEQGVIIPRVNVKNVTLRSDVSSAIQEGKFHVYAVETIDEGMEILTGKEMGEKIKQGKNEGKYRKGTINFLVEKRLNELAQAPQNTR